VTNPNAPGRDPDAVAAPAPRPPDDRTERYPPIGAYGLIGDMHSCALVSDAGSIDWCTFPRFDSPSVFGRLLDWDRGGHYQVVPTDVYAVTRAYTPGTNVLETTFETRTGTLRLTDFMPLHPASSPDEPRATQPLHQLARIAECLTGYVDVRVDCHPRFDYGSITPHISPQGEYAGFAHGGADSITFFCSMPVRPVEGGFIAEGRLEAGETLRTTASYHTHFGHLEAHLFSDGDLRTRLHDTVAYWQEWLSHCRYEGEYRDEVLRSALTLKALIYAPSGAMVAAATTSLPEHIGGERNWDYRYTWVRDASFAIYALSLLGLEREAHDFKEWVDWSTTGRARDLQVMYGLAGERRLTELALDHLEGYRGSKPVRIGNGASKQLQLDIYGEVLDAAHIYRRAGGEIDPEYWEFLRRVVAFVIDHWREPDDGVWEARSGRRHHTFSKVMCWVALDRAIRTIEECDLEGDLELWQRVRAEIRADVLERGVDAERGTFVGAYGEGRLDASLLMLPLVRFIEATDPLMRATIEAIATELASPAGFIYRYRQYDDGLDGDEGTFVICSLWLVDNLILLGETDRARELFDRICARANDLGLHGEEIGAGGEILGNFPQAFSHLAVINAAIQFERAAGRFPPPPP